MSKRDDEAAGNEQSSELHTLIGKSSVLEGKLSYDGVVRIDGQLKGSINTGDRLIISAGATVQADVVAGTVVVYGVLEGTVRATALVELHPGCRVKADVEAPSIQIARGASFDGSCRMGLGEELAAPAERRRRGSEPRVAAV